MTGLRLPPLALYIHIPWCERKCPYCDFNSHQAEVDLPETRYVSALLTDLSAQVAGVQDREVTSVFIGGGTPSLFSVNAIESLLTGLRERLALATDCEITLEANPGSAEAEKFAGFAEAGVNRLSLAAVGMAKEAGFRRINIDLMHGLPGQAEPAALADLSRALAAATGHLSWYQLTIERNTEFYKRPPILPVEDELAAIQESGEELLESAGLGNYEVSAWARPDHRCRHNLNYWEFGDYLGIGAGAHGKITLPEQEQVVRTTRRRQPDAYLMSPDGASRVLDADELCGDFMLNALRLTEGFEPTLFTERTGLSHARIESTLDSLVERGLLDVGPARIRPTALGRRFLDSVIAEFL